ncbi:MAG: diguanylate cyclase [Betaproteobacteria bacterium]|nr:diguanylate cyclase [Betaproteobacteria bacterium]
MKALVVEDSAINRQLLCRYVEKMGILPLQAETGLAGVDLFSSEHPDLVLLDIVLPDIDGFEVTRRIRQLERPNEWTPIIFLSALNKDEDIEKGIAAGGDDYLCKPVSEVVLCAKVRAMQRIIQIRQSLLVLTRKLDAANQELKRLSSLDGLTGIPNRRHFDDVLAREWRRALRQGAEVSIIMCDVDLFKQYNDAFGHQDGDECLRKVSKTLTTALDRGGDLVARYGGEEFVAVLSDTSASGALYVAERMREAVSLLGLKHPGSSSGHITASFGIASARVFPEVSPQAVLEAADRALYQAKREGRNRVCRAASLEVADV